MGQAILLVKGLQFTEGPAVNNQGLLYFSDVRARRIYMFNADGEISVFLENSGGANGLYFDSVGNLVACAGRDRKLISISPDKKIKTLVDQYDGKKLNSPNDLWIAPNGNIYFTDPRYGNTDNLEQDGMHVYCYQPATEMLTRVTDDLVRPNGIVGSTDGRLLYVVDQGVEKTYRYKILPEGTLAEKELFAAVGTDGMSIDPEGTLYITHQKGIGIFSQDGQNVQSLSFEAMTTNVVFSDGVLYVTTQQGEVYLVDLKIKEYK